MKILHLIYVLLFSSLSFFSCTKDKGIPSPSPKKIDTIFPLSYFPTYPGSWWSYSNGDTMTVDGYAYYKSHTYYYTMLIDSEEHVLPRVNSDSIFSNNSDIYVAKDIGLIKRETRNSPYDTIINTEFTLLNYHINK